MDLSREVENLNRLILESKTSMDNGGMNIHHREIKRIHKGLVQYWENEKGLCAYYSSDRNNSKSILRNSKVSFHVKEEELSCSYIINLLDAKLYLLNLTPQALEEFLEYYDDPNNYT